MTSIHIFSSPCELSAHWVDTIALSTSHCIVSGPSSTTVFTLKLKNIIFLFSPGWWQTSANVRGLQAASKLLPINYWGKWRTLSEIKETIIKRLKRIRTICQQEFLGKSGFHWQQMFCSVEVRVDHPLLFCVHFLHSGILRGNSRKGIKRGP